MSNLTNTAPERIWIDTKSDMWGIDDAPPPINWPEEDKGHEYIRADLAEKMAIDFAGWCSDEGFFALSDGTWYCKIRKHYADCAETLYQMYLKEKAKQLTH